MKKKIRAAVLGSTGYVGMELVKILSNHSYVDINFLGSETIHDSYLNNIDNTQEYNQLPLLRPNNSFNTEDSDFKNLIIRLKGISQTIALLEKKYLDKF